MKAKLLLLALLCSSFAKAQAPMKVAIPKVDLGIKIGANFAQLKDVGSTNAWQNAYKPGILAGLYFGVHNKHIGVQIEALVNTATYHLQDSLKTGIRATYISIPLLFELKILPHLWLQLGPQYSGVVSTQSINGFGYDAGQVLKSGDFDGVLGLELKLPLHLNVGARYILGFTDMNNGYIPAYTNAWKRRSIQLSVGFSFL